MSKRKVFDAPKFQEVTIRSEDSIVGHVRVKPSGVAWKAKGTHSKWHMLSLEKFAELAIQHGKEQKK